MKTQILHLEIYDDVVSILDKIKWSQTPRILLVWPPGRRPRLSKIDLLRIQRQSDKLGGQIAVLTSNENIRQYARELGIPVFKSVRRAQSTSWARTLQYHRQMQKKVFEHERETKDLREESKLIRPASPKFVSALWFRLIVFTLGVAAFLSIGAVLMPNATIKIQPKVEKQVQVFEVQASIDVPAANISGLVPIYQETIIVEGRGAIPTTGEVRIPERFAQGEVLFTNLTEDPITLPQGLIVATLDEPPLRYLTLDDVRLSGQLNYSTTAEIQALSPGIEYNTPSGTISAVEDPAGLNLHVTNPEAIIGGSYVIVRSPTGEDHEKLFNQILGDLHQTAFDQIKGALNQGDILLSKSLEIIEIHQEAYSPEIDEPADELSLILRIEFASFVIKGVDLEFLGEQVLQANLPEGYRALEDTYQFEYLNDPIYDEPTAASWDVQASWDVVQVIEEDEVIELVLGKDPETALALVEKAYLPDVTPEIQVVPDWWPFLPLVPFSIQVEQE